MVLLCRQPVVELVAVAVYNVPIQDQCLGVARYSSVLQGLGGPIPCQRLSYIALVAISSIEIQVDQPLKLLDFSSLHHLHLALHQDLEAVGSMLNHDRRFESSVQLVW